jgi:ATP-binding cassette subfamily B protein
VALARALLERPAILILDDALSAVDTETETMILDALRKRQGQQTTIVIAHRLSTVMSADRILVLDRGQVIQQGTHESLVAEGGLYRRLWQIQSVIEADLADDLRATSEGALR